MATANNSGRFQIDPLEERIAPSVLGLGGLLGGSEGSAESSGSTDTSVDASAQGAHVSNSGDLLNNIGHTGDIGSGDVSVGDVGNVDVGGVDLGGVGNGALSGNDAGQISNVGDVSDVGHVSDVGDVSNDLSDIGNDAGQDLGNVTDGLDSMTDLNLDNIANSNES